MKAKNDTYENDLIKSIEKDEWVSADNASELKKKLHKAAKNTMAKDHRMNIRIAKRDIESLKVKALEEGMPYQTLVSSILHKYISGKLIEKRS
jgi:predicted DNA binding CopG/RHH family protein